jgi:hypothetical protein
MYLYSLHGWEHNIVIQNEKKFTQEEFVKMCKEVPLLIDGNYREVSYIIHSLKKYGFKPIKYTAGFFTDGE